MEFSAVLMPAPGGEYVALKRTTTQSETVGDALVNLREATVLHHEEFSATITGCPFLTTFEVAPYAS